MTEHTACEECPYKTMGFSRCPNYIETIWHEHGKSQPLIIKDCAPKRTLLMVQELYNRCFSMQQQITQAEGEILKLSERNQNLIQALKHMQEQNSAKAKLSRHLASMKANEDFIMVEKQ